MATPISVLIVEDSASDADLMVWHLKRAGFEVRHERAQSADEMRSMLRRGAYDVVLSDHRLPGFDAAGALVILRECDPDMPFIVVSGTIDEEGAVALMRDGAQDYVMKTNLARLAPAVERELAEVRERRNRREAEAALNTSRMRHAAAIELSMDGYAVISADGRLLEVNSALCALTGYAREELLMKSLPDLEAGESASEIEARKAAIVASGRDRFESRWKRQDGAIIDIEAVVTYREMDDGDFFCFVHDITERKQRQQALSESEERFRGLVEQSLTGIYVLQDGRFAYVNPRFAELLGYEADEILRMNPESVVAAEDLPMVRAQRIAALEGRERSVTYSFRVLRKDGTMTELGVSGTRAIFNGRPAVIGMAQDITERQRAQNQIAAYVKQLEGAMLGTVRAVSAMVDLRDPYTAGHERRVGALARAIGKVLGFAEERLQGLEMIGLVHDIGKIAVPAEILAKPGKLTALEFEMIKAHPQSGYDIMRSVEFPWPLAETILQHHERLDGSGYPRGLAGDQILPEAKILAVADVVEAMASHRPYRSALGVAAALEEITRNRGKRYAPDVVDACLHVFRDTGYTLEQPEVRAADNGVRFATRAE